jgi:aminoglycoside N3'-acetyltransferase
MNAFRRGQINAFEMPNGSFQSCDLQMKRLDAIRNNTLYRENLEKASRKAGYVDKLLVISRGAAKSKDAITSLLNQNKKAERLAKEKGYADENAKSSIVLAR